MPKQDLFKTHWGDIRAQVRKRFPKRIKEEDLDRIEARLGFRQRELCALLAERCEELDHEAAERVVDHILDEIEVTHGGLG